MIQAEPESADQAIINNTDVWGKKWENFATDAIHIGQSPKKWKTKDVVPPISLASTYAQSDLDMVKNIGQPGKYIYGRLGNPTRTCLEECIAGLEKGSHGLCFATGMAATTAIVTTFLENGDHLITSDDVYGGTNVLFRQILGKFGITCSFVDLENLDEVRKVMNDESTKDKTKLIWLETPSNPTMKIIDIREIAKLAKQNNILSVVDNTFMSSYFQRPILLGVDIVFHSATKYMNGHSDVVMGLVVTSREELHKQLYMTQISCGAVPSPFDCYLVNRGLKTLDIRMEKHFQNAVKVAEFLKNSEFIEKIMFPGDTDHPRHHIMRKQATGTSGMLSFWLKKLPNQPFKNGWKGITDHQRATIFLKSLKVFILAVSLGGYESLAEHPSGMTHCLVSQEEKNELGIADNFVRLSVGLEDPDRLVGDLDQALKVAYGVSDYEKVEISFSRENSRDFC